jgi:hypothetical protein
LSDAQPNPPAIFLDKNHGNLIREMLRRVGVRVYAHRDLAWPEDKSDIEIIRECAQKNFVILSGDKSMERVPEERQEIINCRCKVFMFDDTGKTRTEDWVASMLVGRQRMMEIIWKTEGPLFVTIRPCRTIGHIGQPRFVEKAGGRWKTETEEPRPVPIQIEHPNQPKRKPQQTTLDFPANS